mmetsp:Transcript_13934/g.46154  ORF Transcript_13934/g.46154 Transcript_13934/m.46154 type:complete len:210 (+) Transcript_13934:1739-2368(+)
MVTRAPRVPIRGVVLGVTLLTEARALLAELLILVAELLPHRILFPEVLPHRPWATNSPARLTRRATPRQAPVPARSRRACYVRRPTRLASTRCSRVRRSSCSRARRATTEEQPPGTYRWRLSAVLRVRVLLLLLVLVLPSVLPLPVPKLRAIPTRTTPKSPSACSTRFRRVTCVGRHGNERRRTGNERCFGVRERTRKATTTGTKKKKK